jgi:hypothetical protein
VDRIRRHAERARHERAELDAVLDAAIIGVLSTVVDRLPLSPCCMPEMASAFSCMVRPERAR